MPVIEIAERIHQRLLTIGLLHHLEECQQRVTELVLLQTAHCLHVNHRYQILFTGQTLCREVLQLFLQRCLRTEEMVGAHFQSIAMCEVDVTLKLRIDTVATLRCFQIDVGHFGVLTDGLPEHISLIAAQVDTMHMTAGVLTLQEGVVVWVVQTWIGCRLWSCSPYHLRPALGLRLRPGLFLHHFRGLCASTALRLLGSGPQCIACRQHRNQ